MSDPSVTLVNVDALSYSGTTWLNLLLGSHNDTLHIGPPARLWSLRDQGFEGACLVHGKDCPFWKGFGEIWDPQRNFFLALREYSGKSIFLMDNAPPDFLEEAGGDERVHVKKARYIRDGRAITASYARRTETNYLRSILPSAWFFSSFQAIPGLRKLTASGIPYFHYEKIVEDQGEFLDKAGEWLGVEYGTSALRFWEYDHHVTSGNGGPIGMVISHSAQNKNVSASTDLYQVELDRLRREPDKAFNDNRWVDQLSTTDRFWFDHLMGAQNEALGYQRDHFSQVEVDAAFSEARQDTEFWSSLPKEKKSAVR